MNIEHRKSIREDFFGVSLDESDLSRIASIIENATNEFEGSLSIEVVSGDGEDTYKSTDPQFFFSETMPRLISGLVISYSDYDSPISCKLDIYSKHRYRDGIELSVDGDDATTASGLFRELKRELESRIYSNSTFIEYLHDNKFILNLALNVLVAVTVFSLFDFFLFICDAVIEGFSGSDTRGLIVKVGWGCFYISLIFGGDRLITFLKKCFPIVQFHGHISSPGGNIRAKVWWVVSAIVLPILLNVGVSMIQGVTQTAIEINEHQSANKASNKDAQKSIGSE